MVSKKFVLPFLFVLIIAHLAAVFFGWYSSIFVNILLHFLGGVWGGLLFLLLFESFVLSYFHHSLSEKIKISIIAASFSSLLGFLWIFHEFILSEYFSLYIQESLSWVIINMTATVVGGFIASWFGLLKNNKE
jgi:hypothetical protein